MAMFLGIDIGTSGVKSGIFSSNGELLGVSRGSSYQISSPRPGWAENDPARWKLSLLESLSLLRTVHGIDLSSVSAVGITTFYPVVVPMSRDGRPLYPAVMYCDGRGAETAEKTGKRLNGRFHELTGNRLSTGNTGGVSMAWIKEHLPEIYRNTGCLGFANTYIIKYLTGTFATDPSTASLSGLTAKDDYSRWDRSLTEAFGLEADKLPDIVQSAEPAGTITESAARETGLPRGIPVVPGCGDTPAAAVGSGVIRLDIPVDIAGSSDSILLPSSAPSGDPRLVNSAFPRPGWFGIIGTVTSSGASLEWFIRSFLKGERDNFLKLLSTSPEKDFPVFLPYLQGERTPHWDSAASGLFLGLTIRTGLRELAEAVLLGTAFALKDSVSVLEETRDRPFPEIRMVGGGTAIERWNRMKADVLERPVRIITFPHTGVLGAAVLAAESAGETDFSPDIPSLPPIAPDDRKKEQYREMYGIYRSAYTANSSLMKRLSSI
ncbi:MAG: xylulokinase [Spirochaetia bacterium]